MTNENTQNTTEAANNQSKKDYYKNLITKHKAVLQLSREIIETLLIELKTDIDAAKNSTITNNPSNENSPTAPRKFLFGSKETAVKIAETLTKILVKIIPLEQEIARADLTKLEIQELEEMAEKKGVLKVDLDIIEMYLEEYKRIQAEENLNGEVTE